jgi:glycosyltransferase involved in cell wall biosynthesis
MISFIVIGKNEENNLKRTIEGIYKAVAYNKLESFEIIYVDSKSTDRSIEIVKQFPEVKIFLVTGESNPAVCRNIGAKEAKGTVYFFIDANMEIFGKFLAAVWDSETSTLNENFVSGNHIDIVNGTVIKRELNKQIPNGIFLIRADIWKRVDGMRTKYALGEDYDLGLRVLEEGFQFKRKKEIITNHYITPSFYKANIWQAVWSKYVFYPKCVLLRDHMFSKEIYSLLIRNDKTFMLMVAIGLGFIISPAAGFVLLALYLIAVVVRSIKKRHLPFFGMLGYFIITDFLNLVYLFTFFPKNKKEQYVRVM